ncbi:MAG: pre-peptidase C-terminal domain-containing protein [Roseiflexaceae bacterium]
MIVRSTESQLIARHGQTSVITTIVTDNQGLLTDYPIEFVANLGQVVTPTAITDDSGVATTTLEIDSTAIRTINHATYPLTVTAKSGMITGTVSLTLVAIPCDDIEEKNDGPSPDTGMVEVNTACIGSLQDDEPNNSPLGDDDYYRLDLTSPGTILVTLRGIPQGANYDLQLLKFDDNPPINLGSARQGNADENLQLSGAQAGVYYIRVFLRQKASEPNQNTYILALVVE